MTETEMLQLSRDAESWSDSADWVDNCGRLRKMLDEIPGMVEELQRLRKEASYVRTIIRHPSSDVQLDPTTGKPFIGEERPDRYHDDEPTKRRNYETN